MSKNKTRSLRMITMAIVATVIILGSAWNAGTGSLSAFGLGNIAAICPLGYLETMVAGRDMMGHLLIPFLVIIGLTVLLGRVFCGWICPVPLVRKVLINKVDEPNEGSSQQVSRDGQIVKDSCAQERCHTEKNSSSGLIILGITISSSAIFGFPVFCLICPIGLIFATVFALIRLIGFNEPTLDLIIFPIVIIVELVLLKKWCTKLCPVGALLSILSRFNRNLVPTVDHSRCLEESKGVKCQQCRSACSLDVDIKNGNGTGDISDCTKCKECADNCPVHAIRFPWR